MIINCLELEKASRHVVVQLVYPCFKSFFLGGGGGGGGGGMVIYDNEFETKENRI